LINLVPQLRAKDTHKMKLKNHKLFCQIYIYIYIYIYTFIPDYDSQRPGESN